MNKKLITTIIFILAETVVGTVLGQLYINQYNFWTSAQSLGQFMATVLLIYAVTTTGLGTLNLIKIGRFYRRLVVQCVLTMMVTGAICLFLFFMISDTLSDYFNSIDLDSSLVVLLGLIAGFNFVIVRNIGAQVSPHD